MVDSRPLTIASSPEKPPAIFLVPVLSARLRLAYLMLALLALQAR